jgi:hypothetical protein
LINNELNNNHEQFSVCRSDCQLRRPKQRLKEVTKIPGYHYEWFSTVCMIYVTFFPIRITCYPPMRTINFGKYLRLFQIKPIKSVEFRFIQIGKKEAKILLYKNLLFENSDINCSFFFLSQIRRWQSNVVKTL